MDMYHNQDTLLLTFLQQAIYFVPTSLVAKANVKRLVQLFLLYI